MRPMLYGVLRFIRPGGSLTLRDGLDRYLREVSVGKKDGARQEGSLVKAWLATKHADTRLAKLTGRCIAEIRDEWLETRKPATVVRRLAVLSHLYTVASTDWGYEKLENPVKKMRKPRVRNSRTRRIFNDIQLQGYPTSELDWIVSCTRSKWVRLAVPLAVETAMRRGEITKLRFDDVNYDKRTAFVRETKNGEDRTVPLSPAALELINEARQIHGYPRIVRCDPGSLTRGFIRACRIARKKYVRVCEAQGVMPDPKHFTNLRFHDLRHEAISIMAPHFHSHELARITGHKDTRMLMRYYHPDPAELADRLADM